MKSIYFMYGDWKSYCIIITAALEHNIKREKNVKKTHHGEIKDLLMTQSNENCGFIQACR